MAFHQKQFLPFASGAPSIRALSTSRKQSHVLVTTDRSVAVVQYNALSHEYVLQELALNTFASASAEVIASGVIECPGREAIAIAYAEDDKLYLHVVAAGELLWVSKSAFTTSTNTSGSTRRAGTVSATPSSTRFELVSAPTTIASVKAVSLTSGASELFHGVLLFRADSVVAFGSIDANNTSEQASATTNPPCVRLSTEQFANFFPEFAAFSHPVLAVDTLHIPQASGDNSEDATMQSWIAFGCADGFIRVFQGLVQDDCSCGPYEIKDFQIDGPVTAVSLFATLNNDLSKQSTRCNLLATCAIGHAVVYEDVFGGGATRTEVLDGSDQFDSIFAGIAADIDLDGHVELLLGTDDQQLLAYKRSVQSVLKPISSPAVVDKKPSVSTDGDTNSSSEDVDGPTASSSSSEAPVAAADGLTASSSSEAPVAAADESADPTSDTPPTEQHKVASPAVSQTELVAIDWGVDSEPRDATSTWSQLAKAQWHVEAFGAIYSLAFVDLNRDGVNELLVASATGVFIYEADARCVLHKLEQLLLPSSP